MTLIWKNFVENGWCFLDNHIENCRWIKAAKANIRNKFRQKEYRDSDFRSGATWFAGINFLDNGIGGDVDGISFSSVLWSQISGNFGVNIKYWDAAQVSICWQGYPGKDPSESEKSFKYRLKKYSSHVDGLIPIGPSKRRFAKEFHAFILGIPITNNRVDSAPLMIWEGSHKIFRNMFSKAFAGLSENEVSNLDVTEIYQKYRRKVFTTCPVKKVFSHNNQPYILDRHLLHGMGPWSAAIDDSLLQHRNNLFRINPMSGRIVIYFRPAYKNPLDWITQN
ncbi:MAG: hypothetical protein P8L82_06390 [Paracoccaceae bacterium]|nr:hypothetical protein [Paracoccaceae bacterium]